MTDYLDFYQSYLGKIRKADGENYMARCHFHHDTKASFCFEAVKGVFYCYGCGQKGNAIDFARMMGVEIPRELKTTGRTVIPREDKKSKPAPIPWKIVEGFHTALLGNYEKLLFLLRQRGITLPVITQYQLGYDGERFTIPILDLEGTLVNIRRYLPGGTPKFLSYDEGYGTSTLFPVNQLGRRELFLVEGEPDVLCLISKSLPAITATNGAMSWRKEWNPFFKGKRVILVPDNDEAGLKRIWDLAKKLSGAAKEILCISWEGTRVQDIPGGDTTDYFVTCKGNIEDFRNLIRPISKGQGND